MTRTSAARKNTLDSLRRKTEKPGSRMSACPRTRPGCQWNLARHGLFFGRASPPLAVADTDDGPEDLRREGDVEERPEERVQPEAVVAEHPVDEREAHGHHVQPEEVDQRERTAGERDQQAVA